MGLLQQKHIDAYEKNDVILNMLNEHSNNLAETLTCQRWLRDSLPKRYIFHRLYGDLFNKQALNILDVGGGITGLTKVLAKQHNYDLIELMHHDKTSTLHQFLENHTPFQFFNMDWYEFNPTKNYDMVIANDLFPNVDQRLAAFLNKFMPLCKEMRLSLTYYNNLRFYFTKRLDAEEILCAQAWDSYMLESVLKQFNLKLTDEYSDNIHEIKTSLFPNGRQVITVVFRGGLG